MGSYIVWKSFYGVGDAILDSQHKQILAIISDLYTAIGEGRDQALLKPLLDRLHEYTISHFDYEEQVMQDHAYAAFAEHKTLHDWLRRRTVELRAHMNLVTGPDLLHFLKEWWVGHIQSQDKQYAPYLKKDKREVSPIR